MINIKVKKLHENAIIPEYAHATDSGFDLYTSTETYLKPYSTGIAKTGLAFDIPYGWGIMVRNRSGITVKGCPVSPFIDADQDKGFYLSSESVVVNLDVKMGTVDCDYKGELGIMVYNNSDKYIAIPRGTKLAQGVLEKVYQVSFTEVEELSDSARGTGGFGSTGI